VRPFTDASLKKTTNWVGFINYEKIFNETFAGVITRTFIWTFFSVSIKMIIGVFGATMLNSAVPGRALFRVLTMPPWIVPMAIGIFMWGWMYNGQFGMISGLLQNFGLTSGPVAFLAYGTTAFWATIVTDVWIGVPLVTIYMLAAIQAIPRDLYEAASIDGAGWFQRFRSITLPFLAPTIAITVLLRTVWISNFADLIVVMTNGGPADRTQIVASYIFTTAFRRLDFGYASAIALVLLALLLAYSMLIILLRQTLLNKD